jgi:hypothetical protein
MEQSFLVKMLGFSSSQPYIFRTVLRYTHSAFYAIGTTSFFPRDTGSQNEPNTHIYPIPSLTHWRPGVFTAFKCLFLGTSLI